MSEMILGKDDLIRRQDAIKALEKWKEGEARTIKDYGEVFVLGRTSAFADAIAAMVFVPSADPEIVRCKDCKYRDENWRRVSVRWLPCMDVRTGSNWYCESAERRTDG